jgi:hypothetical protein
MPDIQTRSFPGGLRDIKRKPINLSQASLVQTSQLAPDQKLPLIVTPAMPDVDLAEWAIGNREWTESKLLEHGGILFRGFGLSSATDFDRAAGAICQELFKDYGDLPQEGDSGRIYKSTPYPEDKIILFHNESSHLHQWPLKIAFFCHTPAAEGGDTPILDCRGICKVMDPAVLDKFRQKGVSYLRNFSPGLDVSWQQFFHTDDHSIVDDACKKAGVEWEWVGEDGLRVRQKCNAVTKHPKTGEEIFFNQVQLHHISCLDPATRDSMTKLFGPDELPRNVLYGDGTPIEDETMAYLDKLFWDNCVIFKWEKGDLVLLDNMLTSHARGTYKEPRKIMVAMGQIITQAA